MKISEVWKVEFHWNLKLANLSCNIVLKMCLLIPPEYAKNIILYNKISNWSQFVESNKKNKLTSQKNAKSQGGAIYSLKGWTWASAQRVMEPLIGQKFSPKGRWFVFGVWCFICRRRCFLQVVFDGVLTNTFLMVIVFRSMRIQLWQQKVEPFGSDKMPLNIARLV